MTPPQRKPYFCDAIAGTEVTFPATGDDMGWTIDRLAATARHFPHWQLDCDDRPQHAVTLQLIEEVPYGLVRIGFACNGIEGIITARPDAASGFVLITAEIGGVERLVAYLDRPYEEYDLFPPDDASAQGSEAPGRMSKNLWWVSLSAKAWPVLQPLTGSDWFNARVPD